MISATIAINTHRVTRRNNIRVIPIPSQNIHRPQTRLIKSLPHMSFCFYGMQAGKKTYPAKQKLRDTAKGRRPSHVLPAAFFHSALALTQNGL